MYTLASKTHDSDYKNLSFLIWRAWWFTVAELVQVPVGGVLSAKMEVFDTCVFCTM